MREKTARRYGPDRRRRFRLAGLLLLTALALLLSACGGNDSETGGGGDRNGGGADVSRNETAEAVNQIGVGADADDEEDDSVGMSAGLPVRPPVVGVTTYGDSHYDSEADILLATMEDALPGLDEESRYACPLLAEALDRYREESLSDARTAYQVRDETALEVFAEERENGNTDLFSMFPFYGKSSAYVRRADQQAVSVLFYHEEYTGGVHGMEGYTALNLDTVQGTEIPLDSLLSDTGRAELNQRVGAELDRAYPKLKPGEMVRDYTPKQYTFTLEPDGVTFWFSPYEIASYADGSQTVKLYFDWDWDLFNGEYAVQDGAWCMEFPEDLPCCFSPDGGVTRRTAELWLIAGEEAEADGWYEGIGLELDGPSDTGRWEGRYGDGDTWTAPEGRNILREQRWTWGVTPYYCHTDVGNYLMVIFSMENDAQELSFYSLDGPPDFSPLGLTGPAGFWYPELPEEVEDWSDYDYYRIALTDPRNMPLIQRFYLFGTWNAGGPFSFTPSGVALNGEYMDLYGETTLTLKQPLAVYPVSPDNLFASFETAVTLPAGTPITMTATDGKNTVFFRVEEPVEGLPEGVGPENWRFALTVDDPEAWPRTVNGVPEEELLDGMLYAG